MTFRDRIARGDVLVGDGAVGTFLQQEGLPIGAAPETWTLERPEVVKEAAAGYFRAGSDFVFTNTFGGNRVGLGAAGLSDQVDKINAEGVALARSAAPEGGYVIGSIGPTGESLTEGEYMEIYAEQVSALVSADVDGFCVETVCSSVEGFSGVRAIRELSDRPIILTFAIQKMDKGLATMSDELFADVASLSKDEGVDVLGVNCVGWEVVTESIEEISGVSDLPIAISPNAGIPTEDGGGMRYPELQEDLARRMADPALSGVRIFGGCCGTGPDYIKALRRELGYQKPHGQLKLE
jgi:methionine synthase I (cobalamin-dependent)